MEEEIITPEQTVEVPYVNHDGDKPKISLEILQSRRLRKAFGIRFSPYVRETPKIGRNEPCPCGSGKKYKHCCIE